jgi:hypothetical protein
VKVQKKPGEHSEKKRADAGKGPKFIHQMSFLSLYRFP